MTKKELWKREKRNHRWAILKVLHTHQYRIAGKGVYTEIIYEVKEPVKDMPMSDVSPYKYHCAIRQAASFKDHVIANHILYSWWE